VLSGSAGMVVVLSTTHAVAPYKQHGFF